MRILHTMWRVGDLEQSIAFYIALTEDPTGTR